MGAFALIEKKQYGAFCTLYEESAHLRAERAELADLMPGNYAIALLGAGRYKTATAFCRRQIEKDRSGARDRSSSASFIALGIAYLALGQGAEALSALAEGTKAAYQDSSRTEAPLLLWCAAVLLEDRAAKREAKKLLNARLRRQSVASQEFAAARFLTGKCSGEALLQEVDTLPPVLRERKRVLALLCLAAAAREAGETAACQARLQEAVGLYARCPAVVMELSYHLAELFLTRER